MLQINTKYLIFAVALVIFGMSILLSFTLSPELSEYFGYLDKYTIFKTQLVSVLFGISILFFVSQFTAKIWFNRIGGSIFIVSGILLVMILFVPHSMIESVANRELFLVLGGVTIQPMIFFVIGILWFVNWINNKYANIQITNSTIFILMITCAWFCLKFNDISSLILFELLLIALLFYINGIKALSLFTLFISISFGVLYLLMADHRVARVITWWESSKEYMTTLNIDSSLHENILLSLIDKQGILSFLLVVFLFLFLAYLTLSYKYSNKNYTIFTIGVVLLILIDLVLNILYSFGLLPIYPPTLYLLGFGNNTVVASSLMLGMLLMTQETYDEGTR